jgi:hypothetical protein
MPVITYGYYQQEAAWTGSWTGSLNNPSAADATNAVAGVICAASALSARRHTSCKRQAIGSDPGGSQQAR